MDLDRRRGPDSEQHLPGGGKLVRTLTPEDLTSAAKQPD